MLAQTFSAASAADDQTSVILSENPVVEEGQLNTSSVESSIPENVSETPEEEDSEIPAMATPLPSVMQTGLASWMAEA
jgi:hypothetical protein